MTTGKRIFSGEPLPIPPKIDDPNVAAFHRKLIDYLRRLTGFLDRFATGGGGTGGAGVLVAAAYKDVDQAYTVAGDTVVTWPVTLRVDSPFSFGGAPGKIAVSETGFYVLEVDLAIDKNINDVVRVVKTTGGVDSDIAWSISPNENAVLGVGFELFSMMVPMNLVAGDIIAVHILPSSDSGQNLVAESCRLLLTFYPEEA